MAAGELVLAEGRDRHGDVLLLAAGVGEAEVDELDFALLHHVHHVGDGLGHQSISQAACSVWWARESDGARAGAPKSRTEFSRKHASLFPGEHAGRVHAAAPEWRAEAGYRTSSGPR